MLNIGKAAVLGAGTMGAAIAAHLANAENLNDPNNIHDPNKATVEFVARFKISGGRAERLHEISRFVREEGRWFYVDGKILGD